MTTPDLAAAGGPDAAPVPDVQDEGSALAVRHRVAAQIGTQDLDDYQEAVRLLLVNPLVTRSWPSARALAKVRRWEPELRRDLGDALGYGLDVSPASARLHVRDAEPDHHRPALAHNGRPFDQRRYAYLCLALASLLRAGHQILLSDLARRVASLAEPIDALGFDPSTYGHRLAFIDVVRWIEARGALRTVDGGAARYVDAPDDGEALFDVDPDVLAHLTPRVQPPGTDPAGPDAFGEGRDAQRRRRRQRLLRRLVHQPAVLRDDLADEDREYLVREAASLAEDAERLTGAVVERRAEGLAMIDRTGDFSDRRFPPRGSDAVLALGLVDELARIAASTAPPAAAADVRPTDGVTATTDRAQVELLSGRVVGDDEVDRAVEAVIRRHAAGLRRDVADDAAEARAVSLETLLAFDLLRQAPGGWQVRPALARYRLGTAAAGGSGGGDRAEGSGGLQGSLDFGDGR